MLVCLVVILYYCAGYAMMSLQLTFDLNLAMRVCYGLFGFVVRLVALSGDCIVLL